MSEPWNSFLLIVFGVGAGFLPTWLLSRKARKELLEDRQRDRAIYLEDKQRARAIDAREVGSVRLLGPGGMPGSRFSAQHVLLSTTTCS